MEYIKTSEKVKIGNRDACIYKGKRNVKYVKKNKEMVLLSKALKDVTIEKKKKKKQTIKKKQRGGIEKDIRIQAEITQHNSSWKTPSETEKIFTTTLSDGKKLRFVFKQQQGYISEHKYFLSIILLNADDTINTEVTYIMDGIGKKKSDSNMYHTLFTDLIHIFTTELTQFYNFIDLDLTLTLNDRNMYELQNIIINGRVQADTKQELRKNYDKDGPVFQEIKFSVHGDPNKNTYVMTHSKEYPHYSKHEWKPFIVDK